MFHNIFGLLVWLSQLSKPCKCIWRSLAHWLKLTVLCMLISPWELETGFNTSRFDTNLSNEIAPKFRSLQV